MSKPGDIIRECFNAIPAGVDPSTRGIIYTNPKFFETGMPACIGLKDMVIWRMLGNGVALAEYAEDIHFNIGHVRPVVSWVTRTPPCPTSTP